MSRLPFDIRPLTIHDAPIVSSLLQQAFDGARRYRGAHVLEAMIGDVDAHSTKGLLASHQDDPRGIVLWTERETDVTIDVLFVRHDSRNLGLGERLVNDTVAHARSLGVRQVLGRALPGDRETKNVFERTGLVSQVIIVGKNLD